MNPINLTDLKLKMLELLKKDVEFRYAVAGMLGLDEILRRLEKHDEKFEEILRRLDGHQAELVRLREDMIAGFRRHDEEIAKLREDMTAGFRRHDEEIAKLREDMVAGFKRHDEILERLEKRQDSLESAMISGFGELSKFAGITFEEFVRKFLTARLRKAGEIPENAELSRGFVDGEEIDVFLEDPLIVGEVTSYADSAEDAMKLLKKAELARAKYSREPRKMLIVLTARKDAAKDMRKIANEKGIELIIGKIVE